MAGAFSGWKLRATTCHMLADVFVCLMNKIIAWLKRSSVVAAVGAGILFSSGFAPLFWWPLALLAVGGLYWLCLSQSGVKRAAFVGFSFGLGHHLSALCWLPRSFYLEAGSDWGLGLLYGLPALLGLAMVLSLFIAFSCALTRKLKPYVPMFALPFVFAGGWVGGEFLRGLSPYGFPWNLAGYIWADNLYLLQLAAVGEVWLMSFIALLVAAMFYSGKRAAVASFCLLLLVAGAGYWRLQHVQFAGERNVTVRLVQGNVAQEEKWRMSRREEFFQHHLELMRQPGLAQADIVIWPETAIGYFLVEEPFKRAQIAQYLNPSQTLVTGVVRRGYGDGLKTRYFNSIVSMNGKGQLLSVYDKKLLVPFGEFVPLRKFMPPFIKKLVHGTSDYSQGRSKPYLGLGHNVTALPLICYEAIFPHYVGRYAKPRDFLLNITNDGWFDGTLAPHQHVAMSRVRAVATGKYMVRVANTGVTAVIKPNGTYQERLNMRRQSVSNLTLRLP